GDVRRRARLAGEALHECRRQVSRLVGLLWEASPVDGRARWFTQRHMLERLHEEVSRAERHGTLLSVVLGEVETERGAPGRDAPQLAAWTAEQITRAKRRADVAGQYGAHGFLLLLGHTSEAGAATCCERLRECLQESPPPAGLRGPLRVHFGIAGYSPEVATSQGLLGRAEERLELARAGAAAGGPRPNGAGV
ncbi:MAG TPA: diguanylate cyclase, partial [Gemmataceae bacterium]|nr:diguanylate cyclase [Gemmataceae bacterium]